MATTPAARRHFSRACGTSSDTEQTVRHVMLTMGIFMNLVALVQTYPVRERRRRDLTGKHRALYREAIDGVWR